MTDKCERCDNLGKGNCQLELTTGGVWDCNFSWRGNVTVNMSLLSMETLNRISTSTKRPNVEIVHN